ncbi:hypothetical protein PLICRDRAFT_44105 [Plicaturopsis crispa FD-325 SS-3]|nr:hypothetical protein PLICRDRAFT_44105 [Plicaturopsis crispa FD-325 SS-3]
MLKQRRRRGASNRKGSFNPDDRKNVRHTKIGVWDLYEEINPELAQIPGSSRLETYMELLQGLPYVWRMLKDIGGIKDCWTLLGIYLLLEVAISLIPAVILWYSGQMLAIVETAVETRTVDAGSLLRIASGRVACGLVKRILLYCRNSLATPLNVRIKQHYSVHIFHAMARLDLPTFEDPAVQRQLEAASSGRHRNSVAWDTVEMITGIGTNVIRLASQLGVLASVLQSQRDGIPLAFLSFSLRIFDWMNTSKSFFSPGVFAATTRNDDYVRMQGMKHVVANPDHRKEVVANDLYSHLSAEFRKTVDRVGNDASEFPEARRTHIQRDRLTLKSLLNEPLQTLPEIVFALRAVQYPASIPLSLASLRLIQETTADFSFSVLRFLEQTGSISEQLADVRKLYEIVNIPNTIVDGREPFPENQQALTSGIAVEFRNVSFRYPGSTEYALKNVSFKIEPGQLCVIVGSNGSGKSTCLKLITRLYDTTEGDILIDGRNIRSLKLADLRRATSVLFQDYTHFPLSVRENIGLGDPEHADDDEKIEQAAQLGGAKEFIDRLPEGMDQYLDRPVRDYYSGIPQGTKTLFGRPVDYSHVRGAGGMDTTMTTTLSGGQMQRLAVSRTFMKSLISEPKVGMLLFDEPSASLDPTAEHDLFERLRNLRGNKTMLFSSHRFGNLTRHADIILYIQDAAVQETGTHDELLKQNGEYARIWMLQAQAFLS